MEIIVLAGLALIVLLQLVLLLRSRHDDSPLRQELRSELRDSRSELNDALARFQQALTAQLHGQSTQLANVSEASERRLTEMRNTLENKLRDIQSDNALKLEEMRKTVDEKLHQTLETRLGQSFKLVSERLEQVHKGLGEMQNLAAGVGDLKKVLTNVKTRGTWGEVQLEALLDQILTPEQYKKNVATRPRSNERVEFAICLPGQESQVLLPIDAKFPHEDYERLLLAQERADVAAAEIAARDLENAIKKEARNIRDKYIAPPHTTDFALLYLPTEGLYAEVIRRPGLSDFLQRECRVTVAGPTTLTALLNSLQMGFRTLAVAKHSSEVWNLLGAVKTEFGKFGDVLAKTKKKLEEVGNTIGDAETRTRVIERKLKDVVALPVEASYARLNLNDGNDSAGEREIE
ncbi:MAG: DNA recombination protein RmuC [Burkholderiaceae bacterium]|nr:MAG: DNA recombination protein RmuC [Burkholderiaceae bacterium]